MYYGKQETNNEVVVYIQVAILLQLEEAREGVMLNASEPKIESNEKENKLNTAPMRFGRVVKPPVLYMNEYGSDGIEDALSTIHQYYYAKLCKLDEDEKNIRIVAVGARLGGRFNHTIKLKVMKFKEAMNQLDSDKWKEEIKINSTEW